MEVGNGAQKVIDISLKVNEWVETIIEFKNNTIKKINKWLKELEDFINNCVDKATKWFDKKVDAFMRKIQRALDDFKEWIENALEDIEEWFNETVYKIKTSVVRAVFAKLGVEMTKDEVGPIADTLIPTPPLSIPAFNIPLEVPGLDALGTVDKVTLPRIEI